MAHIENDGDMFIVIDDEGGFTDFSNESEAKGFLEGLE